jgi:cell wall-associated NlpC family hydrolase|tara:strand:- start:25586 stop:26008 length:423 start_codon:yes stop_codon:yes gene_type:complete
MIHWSAQFVGLPYADLGRSRAGVDCWGLAWLVYDWLGIPLPTYEGGYASTEERREIAQLIEGAKSEWTRVEVPQDFDLVTIRRGLLESHIGIVVAPGRMLHVTSGKPSCLEHYSGGPWAARLTGIWRHRLIAEGRVRCPL